MLEGYEGKMWVVKCYIYGLVVVRRWIDVCMELVYVERVILVILNGLIG